MFCDDLYKPNCYMSNTQDKIDFLKDIYGLQEKEEVPDRENCQYALKLLMTGLFGEDAGVRPSEMEWALEILHDELGIEFSPSEYHNAPSRQTA